MKKFLFKAHVDTCLVIEAPERATNHDLCWTVRQAIKDHLGDVEDSDISFEEIKSLKDLPEPWSAECLPYSTEYNPEEKTIDQILRGE